MSTDTEARMGIQSSFFDDFSVPVSEAPTWTAPAPIAQSTDLTAKHCSAMGAQKAEETRETLWTRMIALYTEEPRTDAEIARQLSAEFGRVVAPSTISARRQELIRQGVVDPQSCGTQLNASTGVRNSLWQLKTRNLTRVDSL